MGKDSLDRVEVGTVLDVKDGVEREVLEFTEDVSVLVDCELIHKDIGSLVANLLSQLTEEDHERIFVDRLFLEEEVFHLEVSRDGGDDRDIGVFQRLPVKSDVLPFGAELAHLQGLAREDDLVDKDHLSLGLEGFGNLDVELSVQVVEVFLDLARHGFVETDDLSPDVVLSIEMLKLAWGGELVRECAVEELSSLN